MVDKVRAGWLIALLLGLAGTAGMNPALATEACQGSYTAALLHPLPTHIIADIDVHDRSARNLALARRFMKGVNAVGVAVGAQPNVLLHVSTTRLGATSTQSYRSAVPGYSELPGLQGGPQLSLPQLPASGIAKPRAPPAPPLLFIRVDATVGRETRISWLASVQCQMTGADEGQVAEELGRIIGSTLGEKTERRPF